MIAISPTSQSGKKQNKKENPASHGWFTLPKRSTRQNEDHI